MFPSLLLHLPLTLLLTGAMPITPEERSAPKPNGDLITEWLEWGGPHGDFTAPGITGLIDNFGERSPVRPWRRALGEGYSAIMIKDGRLYTQYRVEDDERIVSLDGATGETLWEKSYAVPAYYEDMYLDFGKGPNSSPLIMGDHLYTVSVAGVLRCSELASGKLVWQKNLHEHFGRSKRKEEFGFSASPINYKGKLIMAVGGDKHGVVALDPKDGSLLWGSAPVRISYAQPGIMNLNNMEQLVFFSPTELLGMDLKNGAILWRHPVKCRTENNLTPALQLDKQHVLATSQFEGGGRLLKFDKGDVKQQPEVLWEGPKYKQAHWNSFVSGEYVYGSFGGNSTSFLAGVHWPTGEFVWRSRGFHLAKGVMADGKFYFTDENGQFAIAKFSPKGVEILDSFQLLSRVSWTPPTLVGTRLYLRDTKIILSVELAKPQ